MKCMLLFTFDHNLLVRIVYLAKRAKEPVLKKNGKKEIFVIIGLFLPPMHKITLVLDRIGTFG